MIKGTNERSVTIRLGCAVAYGLWLLAVVLLMVGTWADSAIWQNWGLCSSAAAATATVRCYFVTSNRLMRAAFEYGREQGRSEMPTPIRPPVPR